MPKVRDTYPDKFMKAIHIDYWLADSDEEHVVMTIKATDTTEYADGKQQILLKFRETHLELGLNKGNAQALVGAFGSDESDDWCGKKVALHTEDVANTLSPTGRSRAIRISPKQTTRANRPPIARPEKPVPAGKPAPMTQAEVDDDDAIPDIPF